MSRTHKDRRSSRDNERWCFLYGIPSWFKFLTKRRRRAKERGVLERGVGLDVNEESDGFEFPRFRRSDHWDWW